MRNLLWPLILLLSFTELCSYLHSSNVHKKSDIKIPNFRSHYRRTYKLNIAEQSYWISPEGLNIEVLSSKSTKIESNEQGDMSKPWYKKAFQSIATTVNKMGSFSPTPKPPILFVHGSFHGAWCWAENFFEGYDCYGYSLRGTSNTGLSPGDRSPTIRVEEHVNDLEFVIRTIRENNINLPPPIIMSHSAGGVICMKFLESEGNRANVSAGVWLCSVPPSGNGPMTSRFVTHRLLDSLKIVWGFVFKGATTDLNTCRELFFDELTPDEDIRRYMRNFLSDSRVGLDLISLGPVLPIVLADPDTGRAAWLKETARANDTDTTASFQTLVLGAAKDFIVDEAGIAETARYFGVSPVMVPNVTHDVMLGPRWNDTAEVIGRWLKSVHDSKVSSAATVASSSSDETQSKNSSDSNFFRDYMDVVLSWLPKGST
eukprot:gene4478-8913_t